MKSKCAVARAYVFVVISYICMRNNREDALLVGTGTEFTSLNKEPNGTEN